MKQRIDYYSAAPDVVQAQRTLSQFVRQCGLEHSLLELVKIRASQINGCAYCLEMHTRDARAAGETETRIYLLSAWRESPLFTKRERAALEWTEALTLVAETHVPDDVFERVRAEFSEPDMVKLTLAIGEINTWNRFAIGFRSVHPMPAKS